MEAAKHLPPKEDPLKRSLIPDILETEDLALHFRLSRQRACELLKRGDFGPYARVGRRYVVRRESLLHALEAREVDPAPRLAPVPPPPLSPSNQRILNLLRGRKPRREEDGE